MGRARRPSEGVDPLARFDALIFVVNVASGLAFALLVGALAAREWPRLARSAGAALAGLGLVLAIGVAFGRGVHPIAALIALALASGAWAAAPLAPAGGTARAQGLAAGGGAGGVVLVVSALSAWWAVPFAALLGGAIVAFARAWPSEEEG